MSISDRYNRTNALESRLALSYTHRVQIQLAQIGIPQAKLFTNDCLRAETCKQQLAESTLCYK